MTTPPKIDIGIDLHESAPEYPVINALVFHEGSAEIAALAVEAAAPDANVAAAATVINTLMNHDGFVVKR